MILGVHLTLVVILVLQQHRSDEGFQLESVLLIQWCVYISFLSIFHLAEFFVTSFYNSSVVSAQSFLIDQSKEYTMALLASWAEFWIEFILVKYFDMEMVKFMPPYLRWLGLVFVISGQVLRYMAMKTCGPSFNHIIQRQKKSNHVLITHGVYSVFRHPSYVGWFYWSVGTQLLLLCPFTTIAYAVTAWYFFMKRIPYEEGTLVRYFGDDYKRYIKTTWIGIPFIPRIKLESED